MSDLRLLNCPFVMLCMSIDKYRRWSVRRRMRRWMLALSSACDVVYTKQRQCVWRVIVDRCLLYERSMCSAFFGASELLFTRSDSGADTIVGRDVLV